MTTLTTTITTTTAPAEDRPMTPEISRILEGMTEEEIKNLEEQVRSITDPEVCPHVVDLEPEQAAWIYLNNNTHNRDLSVSRVSEYQRAMDRGEWMANHQGIAFYENGELADGQHRLAATALSGCTIPVLIFAGFKKAAIQTIDQVKARSAGDALKMEGVEDATVKANLMKQAKEYRHMVEHAAKPKYSTTQIIEEVREHGVLLSLVLHKADLLLAPVTDSPMKRTDVALQLFIMTQYGLYNIDTAIDFINDVLTGTASYEGAPQLILSRILTRAKHGAKTVDRLSGVARIATIQKAAKLWQEEQKCSKLIWSKKEGYPLASAA